MKIFKLGNRLQGSYLVDRDGNLIPVDMHVPSTTFLDRGYAELSLTDIEFLYNQGKITEKDAENAVVYWFVVYLQSELDKSADNHSMVDIMSFVEWAELKYAPEMKSLAMKILPKGNFYADVSKFKQLTDKWYNYLLDTYTKLTVFGRKVEFRIQSDGYDWNKVIIDDVILRNEKDFRDCTFTILRESSRGYKAYCLDVSLIELLSDYDKTVMSSSNISRIKKDDGSIIYE